jgi:hypothetical protein
MQAKDIMTANAVDDRHSADPVLQQKTHDLMDRSICRNRAPLIWISPGEQQLPDRG